ncbi:putative cytochrome P450 [Naematelia encephala]|uniref:Putative cytochrome P450 n=1 Tax=Naematelia encephala TaxID=71784 RepID=A0A1Y2BDW5_9TREE|nr:putative cytochrome P450 [Naematelia encephala]
MSFLSSFPVFPVYGSVITTYLAGVALALFGLWFYFWPYGEWTLPFRNVQGPESSSFLWGVLAQVIKEEPMKPHARWLEAYGPTIRYRVFFGKHRLLSIDPTAISYMLSHPDLFPKPERTRHEMAKILGEGVLIAEGDDHRRQRKLLNPSFSASAIRGMVPIFYDKAYELRDKLQAIIDGDSNVLPSPTPAREGDEEVKGGKKIDVMQFLGQATLDVIGVAGFDYDFKALSEPKNELAEAYRQMFTSGQSITPMAIFQAFVPGMDKIPTERVRTVSRSKAITERIGRKLLRDKKDAVRKAHADGLEKGDDIGKDLLSILVRANMASDLKPDQRLTDDEVLAQITTFMLAGNETSSTALTWILYLLSQNPQVQKKIREECASVADERPSIESLQALPYMDAVVRESLRVCPPAPGTIRQTTADCIVPLSIPIKGRDGSTITSVHLPKGMQVFLPIMLVNTSTVIWGPDAAEFKPERHLAPLEGVRDVPGTWGNLLTFLGGARNCIGYRFALAEIKAILFVLIRNFEFEELNSKPVVERKASIVMRPRIVGEEAAGLQMPLMVKVLST